jgi:protein-L-isoaspartate O-methyltransferase
LGGALAINNVDTSRAWFQSVGMGGQTVSQPYIVALMTELASVGRGGRVGDGYLG